MRGDAIPDTTLRHVWQDTTIPGVTNDGPYVEEFYRAVRAMKTDLPKEKRYCVLGGDPPIAWENIVTAADLRKWTVRRDTFAADSDPPRSRRAGPPRARRLRTCHFPRKEVLTNYDMSGWQAQTMTSLLESAGIRPFVIQSDSGKSAADLQPDIASWPVMSLTLVRGTELGAADFTAFNGDNDRFAIRGIDDFVKIPKEQYKPMRMQRSGRRDSLEWRQQSPHADPALEGYARRSRVSADAIGPDQAGGSAAGRGRRREENLRRPASGDGQSFALLKTGDFVLQRQS